MSVARLDSRTQAAEASTSARNCFRFFSNPDRFAQCRPANSVSDVDLSSTSVMLRTYLTVRAIGAAAAGTYIEKMTAAHFRYGQSHRRRPAHIHATLFDRAPERRFSLVMSQLELHGNRIPCLAAGSSHDLDREKTAPASESLANNLAANADNGDRTVHGPHNGPAGGIASRSHSADFGIQMAHCHGIAVLNHS